jgi:hypothetical protein
MIQLNFEYLDHMFCVHFVLFYSACFICINVCYALEVGLLDYSVLLVLVVGVNYPMDCMSLVGNRGSATAG